MRLPNEIKDTQSRELSGSEESHRKKSSEGVCQEESVGSGGEVGWEGEGVTGSGSDVLEMEQRKRKLTAEEATCLRWKSHEEEADGSGSEDVPEIESNMRARVSTR
jgi:hypothetical protein